MQVRQFVLNKWLSDFDKTFEILNNGGGIASGPFDLISSKHPRILRILSSEVSIKTYGAEAGSSLNAQSRFIVNTD